MNAWMDSWLRRWMVGKINTYIAWCNSMCTPAFLHPERCSVCLWSALGKRSSFLLLLWAASPVRLHMGSREEGGGGNDKVTSSKSYCASSCVVRLTLLFWFGDAVLAAVIRKVCIALGTELQLWQKKQTLQELWGITHRTSTHSHSEMHS